MRQAPWVALAAALALTGCGDDGPTTASTTTPSTTTATATTPPAEVAPSDLDPPPTDPSVTAALQGTPTRLVYEQPAPAGAPRLLLVGDSLAVGMSHAFPPLLDGWRVVGDAQGGRNALDGVPIWRERTRDERFDVSAFSLLTNDHPTSLYTLETLVRETVDSGRSDCVVWATVALPTVAGRVSPQPINDMLARVAAEYGPERFQLVPWAETVAARPELLLSDGVHGTDEGNAVRAGLYSDAVERCTA